MKRLYRKGTVHPSPPVVSDHLSFLPAAILTLAAALSPDDREVLAYLLISNNNNTSCGHVSGGHHQRRPSTSASTAAAGQRSCSPGKSDHPPMFGCDCFECYMSYWVRWDSSPNRQLIHEIIDQFEDGLAQSGNGKGSNSKSNAKTKKEKRKQTRGAADSRPQPSSSSYESRGASSGHNPKKDELGSSMSQSTELGTSDGGTTETRGGEVAGEGSEKGSVRRLVSFIGERIWGVWN